MLLLSIWLFSVRCQRPSHLSAQEGGLVRISCPYDPGNEIYPKYFSKGDYGKRMALIKTTDKKTQKEKYYLCDDTKNRILHFTIYKLTLNDAGTYWCEIDTYWFDPKTEFELKVYKAPPPLKPPPITSSRPISTTVQAITRNQQHLYLTESSSSATLWFTPPADVQTALLLPPLAGKELYLIVAAAALLLLCLMVFLYFRLRKRRHDTAREDTSAGVISQPEENVCTEAGHRRISEDLHLIYSTVCFNTDTQPRREIRSAAGPSEVYATIKHPKT